MLSDREIIRAFLESPIYFTLTPKERLENVKFVRSLLEEDENSVEFIGGTPLITADPVRLAGQGNY